jgi:hypothetical protein
MLRVERRLLPGKAQARDRQLTLAASVNWTPAPTRATPSRSCPSEAWHARSMTRLPSLYKTRGVPVKMPICAICLDRTRGRTLERELTHGVRIWLCEGHHSVAFMRASAGREFAVTLLRIWRAQGCLTRSRSRALEAHVEAVRSLGRTSGRRRPGSYAWPRLREEAEECFARGERALSTIIRLRERHARDHARVPSVRTMRRWFSDGRWLRQSTRSGEQLVA